MGYRYAGGAMLALDGLFLAAVAFVGVRGSRAETQAQRVRDGEASHKRALEQMLREGTLDRYLREVREAPTASIPQDPPTTPSSPSPSPSPSPGSSA